MGRRGRRKRKRRRRRRRLLLLAALALAGPPLLAAAAAWWALPEIAPLRAGDPGTTAYMRLHLEEARAEGRAPRLRRTYVPLERISPHLQRAVVIAEDHAFFTHSGVDWSAVREAAEEDIRKGRLARGASTITMQTARNLYLSPRKSFVRKFREVLLALWMERHLPKERILEIYLNLAEWGEGIYGAEAAARAHFGKPAAALTEEEAAWLAAMLPNPTGSRPSAPGGHLRSRQVRILQRMHRWHIPGWNAPPSPPTR